MTKKLTLSKAQEKYIRQAIAVDLTSNADTVNYKYPDIQRNVWDDDLFIFDEKYFKTCSRTQKKSLKIAEEIFNQLKS